MNLQDSKEKLVLKKVYKKGESGYFASSFADIKKIARMEENKVFIFSGEFLDYDCQLNTKMIKNAMKMCIRDRLPGHRFLHGCLQWICHPRVP